MLGKAKGEESKERGLRRREGGKGGRGVEEGRGWRRRKGGEKLNERI